MEEGYQAAFCRRSAVQVPDYLVCTGSIVAPSRVELLQGKKLRKCVIIKTLKTHNTQTSKSHLRE